MTLPLVPAAATAVRLPSLYSGQSYAISIAQQPANPVEACALSNPVGVVQGADVSNFAVSCVSAPTGVPANVSAVGNAFQQMVPSIDPGRWWGAHWIYRDHAREWQ